MTEGSPNTFPRSNQAFQVQDRGSTRSHDCQMVRQAGHQITDCARIETSNSDSLLPYRQPHTSENSTSHNSTIDEVSGRGSRPAVVPTASRHSMIQIPYDTIPPKSCSDIQEIILLHSDASHGRKSTSSEKSQVNFSFEKNFQSSKTGTRCEPEQHSHNASVNNNLKVQSYSLTLMQPSSLPYSRPILPLPRSNHAVPKDNIKAIPATNTSLRGKKRKSEATCLSKATKICTSTKRKAKNKTTKIVYSLGTPAKERLCDELWMRIFELTDARFLNTKARLICRRFREIIDNCNSIFLNQRIETYGNEMPGPPPGISERQYSNLLGGKGCEDCSDRACTAAKWAWFKRWCVSCWEKKIAREHKIIKEYENEFPRGIILQLLECLPYCMHDSYMKPHDVSEAQEPRPPTGPKVHKFYQIQDMANIVAEFKSLTPAPYVENPDHTPEEKASTIATYQELVKKLDEKRESFLSRKARERDELMTRVCKIESAIRTRRREISKPNKIARKGRREYHTKMAMQELPHIPIDFIQKGKAYKASCRIYRNAGTERTWKALKPKIEKEWKQELEKRIASTQPVIENQNSKAQFSKLGDIIPNTLNQCYWTLDGSNLQKMCPSQDESYLSTNLFVQTTSQHQLSENIQQSSDIGRLFPYGPSCASSEYKNSQNRLNFCLPQSPSNIFDERLPSVSPGISFQADAKNLCGQTTWKNVENSIKDNRIYLTNSGASDFQCTVHRTAPSIETWLSFSELPESSLQSGSFNTKRSIPISSLLSS